MILRLKGTREVYPPKKVPRVDTVTNDAEPKATVCVARDDSGLVPLMQYDSKKLNPLDWSCACSLVLMEINNAVGNLLESLLNPAKSPPGIKMPLATAETIHYKMPTVYNPIAFPSQNTYTTDLPFCSKKHCYVCKEPLSGSQMGVPVRLLDCGHESHWRCLRRSVAYPPECPVCSKPLFSAIMKGKMPSGTMSVSRKIDTRAADNREDILEIIYSFPSGLQRPYHERPGGKFEGSVHTAYLPDNDKGRRLLTRLKKAFSQGLTYGINDDVVTMSIPHCSSLQEYEKDLRFFSARFIDKVHSVLDKMNVQAVPENPSKLTKVKRRAENPIAPSKKKWVPEAATYVPLHPLAGRYVPRHPHTATEQSHRGAMPDLRARVKKTAVKTPLARAWQFVELVLAMHSRISKANSLVETFIQPLAADDMVEITERFIEAHAEFKQQQKSQVDTGFHYTE